MKKTYYLAGEEHPAFKAERNYNLIVDRYPNWPATGTTSLTVPQLQEKYEISRARVYAIIKRVKEIQFNQE